MTNGGSLSSTWPPDDRCSLPWRLATRNRPDFRVLLEAADPVAFLLVGSRQAPDGRPPGMSVFNVFFDIARESPV